ncbi:MAG: transcription antitermination factor NusB [Rhodothermales bacterium]
MSSRREVRARVMQALYARELSGDGVGHIVKHLLQPHFEGPALRFAERLFLATLDHEEETDELIEAHAKNWGLNRIATVDRLTLRQAITELLYFEDIPPKVSINEAIEVAKQFSTEQSGTFLNGILDAVLTTLKDEGRLRKTGRGLVDITPPSGSSHAPSV